MKKLVQIKNLITRFRIGKQWATAVRGIDLDIYEGETLGIVGESGSGKSVSVLSLIQLIPNPPGEVSNGEIHFKGEKIFDGTEYNNIKKLPQFNYFTNLKGYLRTLVALLSFVLFIIIQFQFNLSFLIHSLLFGLGIYLTVKLFYSSPYNSELNKWRKKFFHQMRNLRGDEIAMIFQEPMTSLNPVFTIGFQIIESIHPLSILDYMKNGIINSYERKQSKPLNEQLKPTVIFGIIFIALSQLSLGWSFKIFDIIKFYLIGSFIPIFHSIIMVGFYKLISKKTIKKLKNLYAEGVKLLETVGIPDPQIRMDDYPHQFSGGMRQRAMIAMALAKKPSLLIADEPTTALDVTIQAQILNLMTDLKKINPESAVVLITHDLAVVAETCDRVMVMYGGMIQEVASVDELFANPKHPYTHGLLNSIPRPSKTNKKKRLETINGMVPSILEMPIGCKFCTRCDIKTDICDTKEPPLIDIGKNHFVRCHAIETTQSVSY
jgi:oligopeptide/dipeptide ABC transporter ATP-binding protein